MWRKVLIVVQILLIIWILQTNWGRDMITSIKDSITGLTTDVITLPMKQKIKSLREDFLINNMSLQPHQTDYVVEITETAESIRLFHRRYCVGDDKNPYIFGDNKERFCSLIGQSGILIQ